MKTVKLGDFFLWKGKLAKIICKSDQPTVGIEMVEPEKCPHCNGILGHHQFNIIPTSPLFQQDAEPIQTISITP